MHYSKLLSLCSIDWTCLAMLSGAWSKVASQPACLFMLHENEFYDDGRWIGWDVFFFSSCMDG